MDTRVRTRLLCSIADLGQKALNRHYTIALPLASTKNSS